VKLFNYSSPGLLKKKETRSRSLSSPLYVWKRTEEKKKEVKGPTHRERKGKEGKEKKKTQKSKKITRK